MCLGIPGRILSVEDPAANPRMATVDVDGVEYHVCLVFTPEADVGDHVIVHAGFAVGRMSAEEARRTRALIQAADEES